VSDDINTAFEAGMDAADDPMKVPAKAKERADVHSWLERIKKARKFDEDARRQYAYDRRYARGDSSFDVDANIIGTFIDILVSFLYAQDPACDVSPAKCAEVPDIELIKEIAEEEAQKSPEVEQAVALAAAQFPGDMEMLTLAKNAAVDVAVQKQYQAMKDAFNRKQREAKAFAETLELVIERLWKDAKLKMRARPWVRSNLTVSVGWLKASWQERMGEDPVTRQKINDLQDNINKAAALRAEMDEAAGAQQDALLAEYRRQLKALESKVERIVAKGFVIDNGQAEYIQVAPGVTIENYLDADWIAHYIPMAKQDAVADFKLSQEQARKLKCYQQRKPEMTKAESMNLVGIESLDAKDADEYVSNTDKMNGETAGDFVMCVEIWNRNANCVMTALQGLDCWARPEYSPKPTSRFYPFFLFASGAIDGQRHPQSKVSRSAKLVDEYNRIGTAEKRHRSRIVPKTVFDRTGLSPTDVSAIANGTEQEMVGVEPIRPGTDVGTMFKPVVYAGLDPALYDRSRIIGELERIWGIQEALSQVSTGKTATEAQIQQTGFQARTGSERDWMEEALTDLAMYTAEVALTNMTGDDVRKLVGPDAMWQQITSPEELRSLVEVDIRAGSSGKPNTTAERQAWSVLLPQLTTGVQQIAQLRGATPDVIADSLEELMRITVERSGDYINLDQLIPRANGQAMPTAMPGAPMPGQPPAPAGAPPVAPEIPQPM